MVFQKFALFPHKTIIQNVGYGLAVQNIPKDEWIEKATKWINRVGLEGYETYYPGQLSGGMQQRVGLARALTSNAEIMLMDEAFSALDPLIRKEMQDELIRLQKTMQRTIIFITHDFAEALRLGDRIAIMKDGSFDQVGTPEEIVSNPATPYVREFVNDVPRAKVLSVGTVTVSGSAPAGARTVNASDRIETVIPMLLERDEAIHVIDENGTAIGVVNRHNVASMLQAEQR